jgi:cytoskeleton protein RodZ
MERDDFESLPASTFTRGYLRNYANLLGLPGDELVDAYNQYVGETSLQLQQPIRHQRLDRPRAGIPMAVAGLGFVVLLLVAILFWINKSELVSDSQAPGEPEVASESQDRQQAQPAPDNQDLESSLTSPMAGPELREVVVAPYAPPAEAEVEDIVAEAVVPADDMRSSVVDAEVVDVQGTDMQSTDTQNMDRLKNVQQEMQQEVPVAQEQVPVTDAVDDASAVLSAEPLLSLEGLALYLQGDSWVDVRDGKGKRLLYRMGRSGKEYRLEGAPPYRVKLGNAAVVKVYYNGAPFDTSAYTEGNVARFSVGKAGSE